MKNQDMAEKPTKTSTKQAGVEVARRKWPSQQAGYQRNNRKNMAGLGVEVPSVLREQVQQAAADRGMNKQQYVTALLVAAIAEHKPTEPLRLPEAFKGDAAALKRATAMFIAALR